MTVSEILADLETEYRTREQSSLSGSELWDNTVYSEYQNLSDANQDKWLNLCGVDSVDPYGPAVDLVTDIFPTGSTTLENLGNAREENISRADELGLGGLQEYDIEKAISQLGGSL